MLNRAARWLAMLVLLVGVAQVAWAAAQPLRVGILPTLSVRLLLNNYLPLRVYLERELQRPVELLTAPDFRSFHQGTTAGDYDLVVTAPHLARLAQLDSNFVPLATYRAANRAVLVMAKARPVTDIGQLRGKTLAVFDPLALTMLQARRWLAERGLKAGVDYRPQVFPSHNSVFFSVQNGESLLGVTAPAGVKQWTEDTRQRLQVFAELPQVPALIWLAHPRLSADAGRLKTALLGFPDAAEGAEFFAKTAYQGMRPISEEEWRFLDPYAREVGELLKTQP